VSVVGNDDIPVAQHMPIALTTVRAPMLELGRKAAEVLIANIEAQQPLPVENVVMEGEFVVRGSTRAVRP